MKTVENHRHNIMTKADVASVAQLIAWAAEPHGHVGGNTHAPPAPSRIGAQPRRRQDLGNRRTASGQEKRPARIGETSIAEGEQLPGRHDSGSRGRKGGAFKGGMMTIAERASWRLRRFVRPRSRFRGPSARTPAQLPPASSPARALKNDRFNARRPRSAISMRRRFGALRLARVSKIILVADRGAWGLEVSVMKFLKLGVSVVAIGLVVAVGGGYMAPALFAPRQNVSVNSADPALIEKGRYVAQASDCVACHTATGGKAVRGRSGDADADRRDLFDEHHAGQGQPASADTILPISNGRSVMASARMAPRSIRRCLMFPIPC